MEEKEDGKEKQEDDFNMEGRDFGKLGDYDPYKEEFVGKATPDDLIEDDDFDIEALLDLDNDFNATFFDGMSVDNEARQPFHQYSPCFIICTHGDLVVNDRIPIEGNSVALLTHFSVAPMGLSSWSQNTTQSSYRDELIKGFRNLIIDNCAKFKFFAEKKYKKVISDERKENIVDIKQFARNMFKTDEVNKQQSQSKKRKKELEETNPYSKKLTQYSCVKTIHPFEGNVALRVDCNSHNYIDKRFSYDEVPERNNNGNISFTHSYNFDRGCFMLNDYKCYDGAELSAGENLFETASFFKFLEFKRRVAIIETEEVFISINKSHHLPKDVHLSEIIDFFNQTKPQSISWIDFSCDAPPIFFDDLDEDISGINRGNRIILRNLRKITDSKNKGGSKKNKTKKNKTKKKMKKNKTRKNKTRKNKTKKHKTKK